MTMRIHTETSAGFLQAERDHTKKANSLLMIFFKNYLVIKSQKKGSDCVVYQSVTSDATTNNISKKYVFLFTFQRKTASLNPNWKMIKDCDTDSVCTTTYSGNREIVIRAELTGKGKEIAESKWRKRINDCDVYMSSCSC